MGGVTVEGSTVRNVSTSKNFRLRITRGGLLHAPRLLCPPGFTVRHNAQQALGANPIQPIPLVPKSGFPPPLFSAAPGLRVSPLRVPSPCREVT